MNWHPKWWRPDSLRPNPLCRWVAGAGYAVCVDFPDERQIKRWSDERKAAARRRNLERRVNKIAPLFAEELIARELESRPEYFNVKSVC